MNFTFIEHDSESGLTKVLIEEVGIYFIFPDFKGNPKIKKIDLMAIDKIITMGALDHLQKFFKGKYEFEEA